MVDLVSKDVLILGLLMYPHIAERTNYFSWVFHKGRNSTSRAFIYPTYLKLPKGPSLTTIIEEEHIQVWGESKTFSLSKSRRKKGNRLLVGRILGSA